MNKNLYSLVLSVCFSICIITLFSNCDPITDVRVLEVTYKGRDSVYFKEGAAAGDYAYSPSKIKNGIDQFLQAIGVDKSKIATVKFDSATVTIPNSSTLDFSALDEASFTIKGLTTATSNSADSITLKFPKATGKVVKVLEKYSGDVRRLILNSDALQYAAILKTNKPTPATKMEIQYSLTIGYLTGQ